MSRFKLSNTVTFPEILDVKKYLLPEQAATSNDETSEIRQEEESSEEPVDASKEANGDDDSSTKYELFSIMIHSGSATGGHYYAYIKCFETDQWYNFNDERVSKLDKHDIKKAFGTSNSMYSSTTAYMLLYRQKNATRNEKFIKVDEFNEYLKSSLEKEKHSQVEAEKLKELMENSCKIKVIVPDIVNSDFNNNSDKTKNDSAAMATIVVDDETQKNGATTFTTTTPTATVMASLGDKSVISKRREKSISIHKDLTLDLAKLEIIKVS